MFKKQLNILTKRDYLLSAFLSIVLGLITIIFTPIFDDAEFNTDEGIEIAKAHALLEGYELYEVIWSDHPPGYTYILAACFKVFGDVNVWVFRSVSLFFLVVLVFSKYLILRKFFEPALSAIGVMLLLSSIHFFNVAIPLFIGFASMAVFLSSLLIFLEYMTQEKKKLLVLAGILLSFSLLIKLIGLYLLPLYLVIYLAHRNQLSWQRFMKDLFLFALPAFVFLVIIGWYSGFIGHLDQLAIKASSEGKRAFESFDNIAYLQRQFWNLRVFLLISLGSFIAINQGAIRKAIIPLTWLILTLVVFMVHKPLWFHYLIYLSLPVCWLSVIGLEIIIKKLVKLIGKDFLAMKYVNISVIMLSVFLVINQLLSDMRHMRRQTDLNAEVQQFIPEGSLVFTDRPFHVVKEGAKIIPELSVFSRSRIITNALTSKELVSLLYKYQPDFVMFGRFDPNRFGQEFNLILKDRYKELIVNERCSLFQRVN